MHIVIVNPFDPLPWESKRRGRYGQLSAELLSRGHKVTWLTADFHHATKRYRQWPASAGIPGLDIVPLHVPPYHRNIGLLRALSHRRYAEGVNSALTSLHRSGPTVVVASIPPIEAACAAMRFCAGRSLSGVLDIQDAWPKVLELAFPAQVRKLASGTLLKPLERGASLAVESAAAVVAVSQEYLRYILSMRRTKTPVPEGVFPLGFDAQSLPIPARQPRPPNRPLIVSYIGNFGRFYDLHTVIHAAHICAPRGIRFILIGDGPSFPTVVHLARDLGLTNVSFRGRMPFESAIPLLYQSDLGLVPIAPDWPSSMPNKLFDYLFLGLPVVSSVTGALERLLRETHIGAQYQAGNPLSLADTLIRLDADRSALRKMGQRGARYARAHMDGRCIYKGYVQFLEHVVAEAQCRHVCYARRACVSSRVPGS